MLNKLKEKIIQWLIGEKLQVIDNRFETISERLALLGENLTFRFNHCVRLEQENRELDKRVKKVETTLHNTVKVATDIHEYGRDSWAVICIEGKQIDYIKFIPLGRSELRHIQDFLRQFEKGQHIIDSPHKNMFMDKLDL